MRAMRFCFHSSLSNWMGYRSFFSSSTMRRRSESVGYPSILSNTSRRASKSVWTSSTIAMVRTVPPNGGGSSYCLSRRTVTGAAIVAHGALWYSTFIWSDCKRERCTMLFSLSPNDSDSTVATYGAVFLSRQPPVGAEVAAHTIMLSCRAAAVAAVDLVKNFVI